MNRVAIVGAGPAGCIAAVILARGGLNVTLIEQHRYPRDKVCGECVSSLGIDTLRKASLFEAINALNPSQLRKSILVSRSFEAVLELPGTMWGVSRAAMDSILLECARSVGVKVFQPARCEGIDTDGKISVRVRSLDTNTIELLAADVVMLADGKGALGGKRAHPSGDMGLKAHFIGVDDPIDSISLFGVQGHYVGLAPIDAGRWNLAMSVPAHRLRGARGNFDGFLQQLFRENPRLARRMLRAERVGDWLTSPLPRFSVAPRWSDGVIPIGNAAAALEPIGGEGIGLAMRSAMMAAEEIVDARAVSRPIDFNGLRRAMRKLWRRRSWMCRFGAKLLSNPRTATVATRCLRPLSGVALHMAGKSAVLQEAHYFTTSP